MADEIRQGLPILEFADQAAWQHLLVENHASSGGVWLMIAKKGAPRETISYGAALEVALAYGWIDGQKGATTRRSGSSASPGAARAANGQRSIAEKRSS